MSLKSRIPDIQRNLSREASEAVRDTIFAMEAEAKARSRVRTGTMRAGWEARITGEHTGSVRNGVRYTIYNEFGTRYMGAQPMIVPAAEHARVGFQRRVSRIFD